MERRYISLKAAPSDRGTFEGFASVYGVVDSYDDIVMPNSFANDLRTRGSRRPLLWQHDTTQPIGFVDLVDSRQGLIAKGTLLLSVPKAAEAHALMLAGVIDGLSIGYVTLDSKFVGGVRQLTEIQLFEVSCVTFEACPGAVVDDVKGRSSLEELTRKMAMFNEEQALAGLLKTMQSLSGGLS